MSVGIIKICGITSVSDALVAAEAGADAIGLMFYAQSPRRITSEIAAEIVGTLPSRVLRVGVFVNPQENEVHQAIEACGLDTLQFHGDEPPAFCRLFGLPIFKAFRVRNETSLKALIAYDQESWLLDAYVVNQAGGTGTRFDWTLGARAVALGRPVILAGGLNAGNVAEAIRIVRPYGVDVSSGVEREPGRKDPDQVRRFIAAARSVEF